MEADDHGEVRSARSIRMDGVDNIAGMSLSLTEQELEQLKYPTGRRDPKRRAETPERIAECVAVLEAFPQRLRAAVSGLNDAQLDTPYRPGGWTVRQLVHHIADSHMNALIRFKWALSEEEPTIKAYLQDKWAEQIDARTMPVNASLDIIAGLHARLVVIVKSLGPEELHRGFVHPEQARRLDLAETIEIYTWHCGHHLAHITRLKERMGWK